jgi:hypothetical protein
MKELAEALKRRGGLRMRQGVVTAVDGATNSVLIGGSTVPVDGVHHLNSCAPAVDDVVWITSDGADLWILGTHGEVASGLTLEAATITGSTIRTAVTGTRIELLSAEYDRINFYTGGSVEQYPGIIQAYGDNVKAGMLLQGPQVNNRACTLRLEGQAGGDFAFATLTGDRITLDAPYVEVDHDLIVVGAIRPGTNWVSASSDDGIFIQGYGPVTNSWKLWFNETTKTLHVCDGTHNYASPAFS